MDKMLIILRTLMLFYQLSCTVFNQLFQEAVLMNFLKSIYWKF